MWLCSAQLVLILLFDKYNSQILLVIYKILSHAVVGLRSPCLHVGRPSSSSFHNTVCAHVCNSTYRYLPQTLKSGIPEKDMFSSISSYIIVGVEGGTKIFVKGAILFFGNPDYAKFQNPWTNPSWRNVKRV